MTTLGVAISVYNGVSTIDQALGAVAGQSRPADMVVVVDDGSTDDTLARVERWSEVLPLRIVRHERNRGVTAGRTSAVAALTTELVVNLDADDVWLPHHLEAMVAAYQAHPGVVSPCAVRWEPASARPIVWGTRLQRVPRPQDRDLAHLLVRNWVFTGALFERRPYDAVGGCYRHRLAEDWDLWLRLLRAGVPLTVLDEPTVLYRVHPGNISADDSVLPDEARVLEDFLEETSDPALLEVARRSLRHRVARLALRESYDHARASRLIPARRAAVRALRGPAAVGLRGAGMILAPGFTARRRDLARTAVSS